jgi:type IV pilus assembly protein PilM
MASKRILTLCIGSQTISVAEFKPSAKGALILKAFETRELLADPAADASRVSQATLALGEIAEAMRIKKGDAFCCLPSQSVFSRLVKLPIVEPGKLAQTVAFEAQQNIPYPLNEVVWDYKSLSDEQSTEPEVLIVAAKTDILEEWTAATQGVGVTPSAFDLAPLALYNAFRFNYGEPEGCSLLMDLGSRTTNLLFVEPGKFFIRVISSGGSALTGAVAKEFGENFTTAEQRKREYGFVGQGSSHADHEDPEIAKLSKVLRGALTRLHSEVARSISFYRSQQGGSAPTKVYLSGGGARLGMIGEFLQEKLGIAVESFNPLRCVKTVANFPHGALAESAPALGEHIGLALRSTFQCPIHLTLLPPSLQQKSIRSQRTLATALIGLALASPLLSWAYHLNHSAELASELTTQLKPKVQSLKKISADLSTGKTNLEALLETARPLELVARDRQYWTQLINHIHSKLPKELVWITQFEIAAPEPVKAVAAPRKAATPAPPSPSSTEKPKDTRPRLNLRGLYLENPRRIAVVEQFGKALQGSDLYEVAPEQEWTRADINNPTEWAQEFVIPLILKSAPAASVNSPQ